MFGRMDTTGRVVLGQPPHDVGGVTGVVERWILRIPEDVHEPLGMPRREQASCRAKSRRDLSGQRKRPMLLETAVVSERP